MKTCFLNAQRLGSTVRGYPDLFLTEKCVVLAQLDSYAAAALLVHYFKRSAGTPEKMKPFAGGLF